MRHRVVSLILVLLVLGFSERVFGAGIYDYAIFSDGDVVIEEDTTVIGGLVGSNQDVTVEEGVSVEGIEGDGDLSAGDNLTSQGDVIFNGDVSTGEKAHIKGSVHSGKKIQMEEVTTIDQQAVAAKDLNIGKDSYVGGNLDSGEDITLEKNSVVNGNATATGNIVLGDAAVINGSTTSPGVPQSPTAYVPIALPPASVFAAGGLDITKSDGEITALTPGSYGHLNLGEANVLNLISGNYYFESLTIDKDSSINVDLLGGSGEIGLFVLGDIHFGKDMTMALVDGEAKDVYWESHGEIVADKGGRWYGTFFAPEDKIVFGKDSRMIGALFSSDGITLGRDSQFEFQLASRLNGDPELAPVPEPLTVWLFGAGVVGMVGISCKKKKR